MEWYLKVMRQYADFSGRARRKEYWMFYLIYMIMAIAISFFVGDVAMTGSLTSMIPILVLGLVHLLPNLAVSVRRLHDTGRSGWWLLIGLIPLVGAIILLVFLCTDSQAGGNEYGPNPKDGSDDSHIEGVLDDMV